jgi:GntR family transcriptional regulator, rspAB operon transcriptional repressor
MELTRLTRNRANDEVYQCLRQAILNHVFRPGERLQLDEISAKLGVSQTPVRNAVQKLASEGLIEVRPRSGTFVATLKEQDIEETFELRRALECLAAERAITRMTAAEIDEMKHLVAQMAEPVADDSGLLARQAWNTQFHAILIRASGNERLHQMYDELRANIQIARIHVAEHNRGSRFDLEHAEHEAIVAALDARDLDGLKAALTAHIERAKTSLIAALKEQTKGTEP